MPDRDDFYVGYLPMPPRVRTFTIAAVLVVMALSLGAIALAAASQRDPGDGFWSALETNEFYRDGKPIAVEGVLRIQPYPVLHVTAGVPEGAYLVVQMGKLGSRDRMLPYADQTLRVNAWVLERDGRRMLELAPDETDVVSLGLAPAKPPRPEPLGPVTLSGEILDAKCYLGAMSPGDGAGHRACATLCVSGGIPPMLLSRSPDGTNQYHLLVTPDLQPAGETVLDYIGQPVSVEGEAFDLGGLRFIRLARVARR